MPVDEVSIGDYVLAGGEAAALVIVEAVARLLPGVLGNAESLAEESHVDGLLEYPVYTKPPSWRGRDVPEVLLSGDHGAIARWRRDAGAASHRRWCAPTWSGRWTRRTATHADLRGAGRAGLGGRRRRRVFAAGRRCARLGRRPGPVSVLQRALPQGGAALGRGHTTRPPRRSTTAATPAPQGT